MALKIRLTRIGKKNDPKYRIVVCEEHSKRDGKYIDQVGFYDPIPNPHLLTVDNEKLQKWIKNGATLSEGAGRLIKNV
jgi:small subunit ribosomal protein S16